MASEWAKGAAARWMNRAGLFQSITAALDEALSEGEKIGAARERWECYRIAADRGNRTFGFTAFNCDEANLMSRGAELVAEEISARGPMLSPVEEP